MARSPNPGLSPAADWLAWQDRYAGVTEPGPPAQVLERYQHLLPTTGTALDLACGLGGNALFLARRQDYAVWAWDWSPHAIEKLANCAAREQLAVHAEVRDLEQAGLGQKRFDVIVVSRFLLRSLAGPIVAALNPGGLLYYQTFTQEKVAEVGPRDPRYLLAANELLSLFSELRVLAYHDEGRVGDVACGVRNQAMLVGQKSDRATD